MSSHGGRPRTFPVSAVPIALERHAAGETWAEIASDLGVHPNTLRTRAAERLRSESGARKTPATAGDETGSENPSSEAEIVLETFRPPALCPICGMVHSPEVPCP